MRCRNFRIELKARTKLAFFFFDRRRVIQRSANCSNNWGGGSRVIHTMVQTVHTVRTVHYFCRASVARRVGYQFLYSRRE